MDEQKERLEQELRFLQESLEAEVISRDEYERGKERLQRKIREIEEKEETTEEENQETKIEEKKEEQPGQTEEATEGKSEEEKEEQEPKIEIKEIKEQPTRIIGAEETKPEKETPTEEKKTEEAEIPEKKEEPETRPEESKEPEEEEKTSSKWAYAFIIIILALILFFFIRGCGNPEEEMPLEETFLEEITPACSSDSDCQQEGAIGTCSNPGTKEAVCEFKQDIESNLLVINDKSCKSCDSTTTKAIIKTVFPNIDVREVDFSTEEAKNLTKQLKIDALPAYVFEPNIEEAINFDSFKSALSKRGDNYVMTNTASGAIYYFNRPLIENNLDIYMLPETAQKIDPNIEEVSALFNGKLKINKHLVTERQKKALEEEIDINTYPTFLFNNQVKFRGILPANLIKEKICEVNAFEECKEELSRI